MAIKWVIELIKGGTVNTSIKYKETAPYKVYRAVKDKYCPMIDWSSVREG